jgi:hypothetical protein
MLLPPSVADFSPRFFLDSSLRKSVLRTLQAHLHSFNSGRFVMFLNSWPLLTNVLIN